jgi:sulfopyruvate decarboxylase subunit beta
MPFADNVDYADMARAAGVERVYAFSTVNGLAQALDEILIVPGHVFAVLDVEPLGRKAQSPPLDGPELKFRFGRYLERTGSPPIFDAQLHRK